MATNPPGQWWDKLVVSLEFADLNDPVTRDRLDSAAAKANNQGLHMAVSWQYARALPMLTAAVEVWSRIGLVPGRDQRPQHARRGLSQNRGLPRRHRGSHHGPAPGARSPAQRG